MYEPTTPNSNQLLASFSLWSWWGGEGDDTPAVSLTMLTIINHLWMVFLDDSNSGAVDGFGNNSLTLVSLHHL